MRSELVSDALKIVRSRYVLCHATVRATRKFHKQGARIQQTMNDVLARFAKCQSAEKVVRPTEQSAEQRVKAA